MSQRRFVFFQAALVLALLAFASTPALPQAAGTLGTIEGTVKDATGGILPGSTVTVRNVDTGFTRSVLTGGRGNFKAPLLPLGKYSVTVELAGFNTLVREGIILTISSTVTLPNLTLEVATVEETVTVTAESPVVETSRAVQAATFEEQAIESLPINSRDFQDFATLTPTVIRERGRDTISMGGQKGIDTNVSLDGMDFNNPFFGQASGQPESKQFVIAQEAVKEFQVLANGYSAEFGRSAGGVLNVVTKSGTNDIRGSGFYFGRNEALKSTLTTIDGNDIPNTGFSQHQFGGSVGGPIQTNRAHYFVAVEQQFFDSPFTVKFDRETGDLSNVALFGQPISGVDVLADEEGTFAREVNLTAFLAKLDFQLNDNNTLSFRYNYSRFKGVNFGASAGGVEGTVQNSAEGTTEDTMDTAHSLVISNTTVIGTDKFNELRFQYSFEDRPRLGTSNDVPEINIGDVGSWGRQGFLPITSDHSRIQITDNFTYLFGDHDLKVGADLNFTSTAQTFMGFSGGQYDFNTLEDYVVSNFNRFRQLVGLNGFTTPQSGTVDFGQQEYSVYIQDNWKPKPGLTVNLGLRWEGLNNPTVPTEEFGLSTRNPDNPGDIFGLDQQQIANDWNNWAPRFGFAYDPSNNGRTVIRGGVGKFFSRTPLLLLANILTNNGFRQGTVDLRGGFEQLPFTFPEIFPEAGLPPDSPLNETFPPTDVFFWDPEYENPEIWRVNAGVEHEVVPNFSVGADFVYADNAKGQRRVDINITPTGVTDPAGRLIYDVSNRPDPDYRRFALNQSNVNGDYKAFILSARKRYSQGILFQTFYTWSHTQSEDDNERSATGIGPSQPENLAIDFGDSDRDIRHRFVANVVGDLPAGFQLSSTIQANSGDPFNVTTGIDNNLDGQRLDRPVITEANNDLALAAGQDLPLGLQPRNSARQPNFYNVDLRVTWGYDFDQRGRLEITWDVFNLFNNANRRTNAFNYSRTNFGLLNIIGQSRQSQIGLRYRF